jgi:hypothetical protein
MIFLKGLTNTNDPSIVDNFLILTGKNPLSIVMDRVNPNGCLRQ